MEFELDQYDRSDLHYAAHEGDSLRATELIKLGVPVSSADSKGWTPLHFAAQANSPDIIRLLLEAGAEVDAKDSYGNTPLWRAVFASRGKGESILLLRKSRADSYLENNYGISPLSLARGIANYDVAQYFDDLPLS